MNSIFLPLRWDPQQKVQFHCQILSNFLKISKSQKTRGGISTGGGISVVIWTDIFMKPMKTIVNFVHNLEIEGIVKIHFCLFFNILCRYSTGNV